MLVKSILAIIIYSLLISDVYCMLGDDLEFPIPSGPYTIGYKNIELEDAKREDPQQFPANE